MGSDFKTAHYRNFGSGAQFRDADDNRLNHQGHEVSLRPSVSDISFVCLRGLGGKRFRKLSHYPSLPPSRSSPSIKEIPFRVFRVEHQPQRPSYKLPIANSFRTRSHVTSSASGSTLVSPMTLAKFASATQRGKMCMWMCPATPAPAAFPIFMPRLIPSGR